MHKVLKYLLPSVTPNQGKPREHHPCHSPTQQRLLLKKRPPFSDLQCSLPHQSHLPRLMSPIDKPCHGSHLLPPKSKKQFLPLHNAKPPDLMDFPFTVSEMPT